MGAITAVAGGAAAGAGAFALESMELSKLTKTLIVGGGGLVLGALATGWNPKLGAGIAGGGGAILAKGLMEEFLAGTGATAGMGRIPPYAYNKFGRSPANPPYFHSPGMGAVRAQLSGPNVTLTGAQQQMSAVRARLY